MEQEQGIQVNAYSGNTTTQIDVPQGSNAPSNTQENQTQGQVQQQAQNNQQPPTQGVQLNNSNSTNSFTKSNEYNQEEVANGFTHMQTTEQALREDLQRQGVDFQALENEYLAQGHLSQQSLDTLAKAGYPKAVVDNYIRGIEQQSQQFYNAVVQSVGGEQEYQAITNYIQNQPQGVINGFNEVIQKGNLQAIQLMLKGVQADMVNTYGTTNRTIMGSNANTTGNVGGFETKEEMIQAISDPKYKSDYRYRAEVEKRIQQSNIFE